MAKLGIHIVTQPYKRVGTMVRLLQRHLSPIVLMFVTESITEDVKY